MDDQVLIAGGPGYHYWEPEKDDLLVPLPPPFQFLEPIEAVQERIAKVIGKVTVPHQVRVWHPVIASLLQEEEERRLKRFAASSIYSSDKPRFDSPFERRRLRILNGLFLAAAKMGGKPAVSLGGEEYIAIVFHQQPVGLALNQPKQAHRSRQAASPGAGETPLALSIRTNPESHAGMCWEDGEAKLEARMGEIAVRVILAAEIQYRERAFHRYQSRAEQRAKLQEQERQRQLVAERAERERLQRIEQARVDRLLKDAAAFQQANEIRNYVETMRSSCAREGNGLTDQFEQWSRWALTQADRIDPALGGAFLKALRDPEEIKE